MSRAFLKTMITGIFHVLMDKFSPDIHDTIKECQNKLKEILTNPNTLFKARVFFKIKKVNKETGAGGKDLLKIQFRPIHTASLIDQICMVSLLMPLLFEDDDKNGRKLSELSKLLPSNFYGNIPNDKDLRQIFKKWQYQYRAYTDNVIGHCKTYRDSHEYHSEITLDIENFFPTVSPDFMFDFIIRKLSTVYGEDDLKTLRMILAKLLYLELDASGFEDWIGEYYGSGIDIDKTKPLMVKGLPQGLPQSYLFANLCMTRIKEKIDGSECFPGDAYFYVDDSVIFMKPTLSPKEFENRIEKLNAATKTLFTEKKEKWITVTSEEVSSDYSSIQKEMQYEIRFHEAGKSEYRPIDEAKSLEWYYQLLREASMASDYFDNLDENEDRYAVKKLIGLNEVIDKEINRLEKEKDKNEKIENGVKITESNAEPRLKILKRLRRYFLFRQKRLELNTASDASVRGNLDNFIKRFNIDNPSQIREQKLEDWFEDFEKDIFQSESRLLVTSLQETEAKSLYSKIVRFEQILSGVKTTQYQNLYFAHDLSSSLLRRDIRIDRYGSLIKWVRDNNIMSGDTFENIRRVLNQFGKFKDAIKNGGGFHSMPYTSLVLVHSDWFKRCVLNALYSWSINIEVNDGFVFVKKNNRSTNYVELRILARLRNSNFKYDEFVSFVNCIDYGGVPTSMDIDMSLLSVIGHFIKQVRNPDWVDNLILTHKIVKGLWTNGSKFLYNFTLHNEEHAVTLIEYVLRIRKAVDYLSIKRIDYYILFLACYLHDISMVIHLDTHSLNSKAEGQSVISEIVALIGKDFIKFRQGKYEPETFQKEANNQIINAFEKVYTYFENAIRSAHAKDSAAYIRKKASELFGFIEPATLSLVADVSESHGFNSEDVYGLKSRSKDDLVSLKYMMILLRLADLFDISNNRVNYHLLKENAPFMSDVSLYHWTSHLITDCIRINPEYNILPGVKVFDKSIQETINVEIYLNVKYKSAFEKQRACEWCGCSWSDSEDGKQKNESMDSEYEVYSLSIGTPCKLWHKEMKLCPLLCMWVTDKHNWLINELKELNDYLNNVNNSLIRTSIKLNIKFRDDFNLDPLFLDKVCNQLKKTT